MLYIKPKFIAVNVIKAYQRNISLDHGILKFFYPHGYCKFNPTCSEYAVDAIMATGFIKGGMLAAWRVLRCNPFSRGGNDPANK